MGKVYLVGAGCGDLELYTVKAMRLIEEADCLVYDALIDNEIMDHAKKECEMIYVGKRNHHHALPQEEICALLAEKSKEHETVVRLKGGDVYVFGRGGEEGEYLFKHGVDFEVVPGVSSCTAGLAYAGIPITHRGISGGFQVYTAQLKQNTERSFDFSKMLDDYCTYVFLMGMSKLEMIVSGFLAAGKKKTTGVAVISNASLPIQRTLTGTLEDILDKFKANPLPTPGLIVVGDVVNMREYLNFFETKPLFGKKILVTVVGKDHQLASALRKEGANLNEVMTGEITYLDVEIPSLSGYLIFTSQHGVHGFMQNFKKQYHDIRSLSQVKIIAIGKKTNATLNNYGLNADFIPSVADSDILNEEIKELVKDESVYLMRGDKAMGLKIPHIEYTVYKNSAVEIDDANTHYDYGLFTCASSVERFSAKNASQIDTFISIGKHTTKAIQKAYGEDVCIIETKKASKDAMLDIILKGE